MRFDDKEPFPVRRQKLDQQIVFLDEASALTSKLGAGLEPDDKKLSKEGARERLHERHEAPGLLALKLV